MLSVLAILFAFRFEGFSRTIFIIDGILMFMFLVGLDIDVALLRRHAAGVIGIAVVSLVVPFLFGLTLAFWLYPPMHGAVTNRLAFVLFIGTAMAISAMPVLTRILADWRMLTTTIGTVATGCAAVDDVVAWTMLGIVTGIARGRASPALLIATAASFVLVMLFAVRPLLGAIARRQSSRWPLIAAVIAVTAASAFITERIGIHMIFGAFLAGACVPRRHDVLWAFESPLRTLSSLVMPAFFILVGLRTQIALVQGLRAWAIAILIVVLATMGKFGASAVAARVNGFALRDALAIGALLNTRGLVGLVALDLGRSLGVLSATLFTMFVIMTFVTTFSTVPLLRAIGIRPGDR